jgi:hypothetical protein
MGSAAPFWCALSTLFCRQIRFGLFCPQGGCDIHLQAPVWFEAYRYSAATVSAASLSARLRAQFGANTQTDRAVKVMASKLFRTGLESLKSRFGVAK